ncbi:hypothetical protein BT63DRAFT_425265 [Microthyrium microscopicum]|uniref:Heterokaryon incompatibility domain-containing protein n=1 Tax=Microthyrium microscopicum TaxID=703497 RepID=A0A6A6UDN5_9PEZI|nr:hypothetical protein BT63DRAFT_425265 [Microthyrium microscopicum]
MPETRICNNFFSNPSRKPKIFDSYPHYEPLRTGQIRLIRVQPGAKDCPIQCSLLVCNLEDARNEYDALSYVWGSTKTRNLETVDIDGVRVRVTTSLFRALQQLRTRQVAPYDIWADAISINQCSVEEKSVQVLAMPEIYSYARTVQIWLGSVSFWHSFSTAEEIADLNILMGVKDNGEEIAISKWIEGNLRFGFQPDRFDPSSDDTHTVGHLLRSSWFKRSWTIQEAALAQSVTINVGSSTLSWMEKDTFRFLKRLKYLEVHPRWRDVPDETRVDLTPLREVLELTVRRLSRQGKYGLNLLGDKEDLLDTVHRMRDREAGDPRDRIYSVMALADDARGFPVDYSLSVKETYEKLYEYTREQHLARW